VGQEETGGLGCGRGQHADGQAGVFKLDGLREAELLFWGEVGQQEDVPMPSIERQAIKKGV
jgi:hypothetical protein